MPTVFGRELPRARPSSRFTSLDYLRGGPGWTRNPACTLYEVLEGPLEILVVHDKSSMSIATQAFKELFPDDA